MSSSISDVAERAGVSVATVSRALRGLPHVAPATRERVVEAARDLHYVASPSASRLAARRTSTVGVVLPVIGAWYSSRILAGIHGVLETSAYDVLLLRIEDAEARDRFVEATPFRKRVDALIVVDVPMSGAHLDAIRAAGVEVVTIGFAAACCTAVTVDDHGAARSATRHLLGLGHRRIGVLGPASDDPIALTWARARREGSRAALAEQGLQLDPALDVACAPTALAGAHAMAHLAAREPPPTAVFGLTDEIAIGAVQAAQDAGLRVPDDVSIVGFDGHELAEFVGLTTVQRDVDELGARAALAALTHLADPDAPRQHHVQPSRVVVRRTTARVR